ncbi:tetratricopeptide repeat protein [Pedobacter sp.]
MKTLIIAYLLLFTATTLQAQEAYRKYTNEMNRIVNERDVIYKSILRGKALVTFYNERKKETDIKAAERETGAQLLHFVDYDTHPAYNFLLANVSRDEINKFLTYIPKEGRTTIRAMVANTVKNANSGAPSTYASNLPKHGTGLKGTWKSHTAIANSNTLPQQPSNGIAEYNKAITAYRAKNNSEAMTWFKQSADKGNANAMFDIGAMYYNGDGVAKNETEAVQWYQKAADNGHDKAKSLLHLIKEQAKYADQLRQTNDTG